MKSMRQLILLSLFIPMSYACVNDQHIEDNLVGGWTAVYKHDENGNSLSGSIDTLIAGICNGYDMRIGWGWEKELGDSTLLIEHMAEPLFLTIIQGKNVSVVIDAHPLLQSYIDIGNQKFGDGIWQCILTTQGTFNAQGHDRYSGELIKDWPQKQKMTWFWEYSMNQPTHDTPLYE